MAEQLPPPPPPKKAVTDELLPPPPPKKAAPVGSGVPTGEQGKPSQQPSDQPQTGPTYSFTYEPDKPKAQRPVEKQGAFTIRPTDLTEKQVVAGAYAPKQVEKDVAKASVSQYEKAQRDLAEETKYNWDMPDTWVRYTGELPHQNIQRQREQRKIGEANQRKALERLNNEANSAQKEMNARTEAEIKSALEGRASKSYVMEADNGVKVVDPMKIGEKADEIAAAYGMGSDSFFRRNVYNKLKAEAEFKIIEPAVNEKFEEKSKALLAERQKQFDEGFTTFEVEKTKLEGAAKQISDDLVSQQKAEVEPITAAYTTGVKTANEALLKLNAAYESGSLPRDQYEQMFEQIQTSVPSYDEYVRSLNAINSKYNQRYRREVAELEKIADKNVEQAAAKYATEFGKDEEYKKKLEALYNQSYQEAFIERKKEIGGYEKAAMEAAPVSASAYMFLKSGANILGGSIKGLGQSMGIVEMEDFGDFVENRYTIAPPEMSKFSDLLDANNLFKLGGQITGGMVPSLVAGATTAAITGGAGAGVGVKMIASNLAAFTAETADLGGRAYVSEFERSGNAGKAEKAASETIKSQLDIILTYSAEYLPFVKGSLSKIKTLAGRAAVGGTIEMATELPQEVLQGVSEENITAGNERWDGLKEKILDKQRIKENIIALTPLIAVGAVGQLSSKSEAEMLSDYYVAQQSKGVLNDIVEDQGRQFLQNIVLSDGAEKARTTASLLFAGGHIDEPTLQKMDAQIEQAEKFQSNASELGLSPNDAAIYSFYAGRAEDARLAASESEDPIISKVYEDQAKDYENAAVEFLKSGEPDLVVMRYKDGSEVLMSPEDARQAFKNPTTLKEFEKGNVQFMAYGKQSEKSVNEFGKQVEAKAKADAQRKVEEAAAAEVEAAKQESIKRSAENIDKKLREGGEVDIDGFVFVSEEKSQPIFDSFTEEQYERYNKAWDSDEKTFSEFVTEEYVKSKTENTNPKFVAAVDRLLGIEPSQQEAVETTEAVIEPEPKPDEGAQTEDITPDGGVQLGDSQGQEVGEGDVVQPAAELAEGQGEVEVVTPEGFQNRVQEGGVSLGKPDQDSHVTEEGYIYRTLGDSEIEAIRESGAVLPREGKQKGGNKNVKYWSRGDGKFFYRSGKQQVIRVKNENLKPNEVVRASDLEIWNQAENRFVPFLEATQQTTQDESKPVTDSTENVGELDVATEVEGALKDVESKFPIGTTIKWDVFGNEKMGDWTIAEHTTTRGGKPAIRLTRFIEQGVAKGGGKAGYTQEHIVSVEDLQAEATQQASEQAETSKKDEKIDKSEASVESVNKAADKAKKIRERAAQLRTKAEESRPVKKKTVEKPKTAQETNDRTNELLIKKSRYNGVSRTKKPMAANLLTQIKEEAAALGYNVVAARNGGIDIVEAKGGKKVTKRGVDRSTNKEKNETRKKAMNWAQSGGGGIRAAILSYFAGKGKLLSSQSELAGEAEKRAAKKAGLIGDGGISADIFVTEVLPELGVFVRDEQEAISEVQDIISSYESREDMMGALEDMYLGQVQAEEEAAAFYFQNEDQINAAFDEDILSEEEMAEYYDLMQEEDKIKTEEYYAELTKQEDSGESKQEREGDTGGIVLTTATEETVRERQAEAKRLKTEYESARAEYDRKKKAFDKAAQQNQVDIYGATPQDKMLFRNDLKEQEDLVKSAKQRVDTAKEKYDAAQKRSDETLVGQQEIGLVESLRKQAEQYRSAGGGALNLLPNAIATALDTLATLIEKYGEVSKAIREWRNTKEYKKLNPESLVEAEKAALEIAEDEYVSPDEKPSAETIEVFSAIDPILEMKSGPEAVAARREYKEKYGKDTYEKAVKITRNFDKIVERLENEGKLKKKCP